MTPHNSRPSQSSLLSPLNHSRKSADSYTVDTRSGLPILPHRQVPSSLVSSLPTQECATPMSAQSLQLDNLTDLRTYVHQTICQQNELEVGAFPVTERI